MPVQNERDPAMSPQRLHTHRWTATSAVGGLLTVLATCTPSRTVARVPQAWAPTRCASDTLATAPADTATTDRVAPGMTYRCLRDRRGPWVVHVVTVDLRAGRHTYDGARALGTFLGRERVSAMAARLRAQGGEPLAGINADFFDLRTGEVENNHVVGGEWVKGVLVTDSPHDEFDNAHTQFAIDGGGRPLIGRFQLAAHAVIDGRAEPLVGINHRPARREGLVLFTHWYGAATPRDTSHRLPPVPRDSTGAPRSLPDLRADSARRLSSAAARDAREIQLLRAGRHGDTLLFRPVPGVVGQGGGIAIPSDGAVLSATGDARALIGELARSGGTVRVVARLGGSNLTPRVVVGGWPGVVANGVNVGAIADSLEGTFPRFSSARHPRSAIGITGGRDSLLLVVVDGRRPWSVGMSLTELGDLMLRLGARDAMNLDGGGSSTLWIRGTVVNYPSDATGERAVANALFVLRQRPE